LSYLVVEVDIVVVGVEVLLFVLLYQRSMDPAADLSRPDPVVEDVDPIADLTRLDPLDVDALLDGTERLLDLPMRAGDSDCCRRLLLDMYNHKLYSLCLLDE
jgi:hypothetical protein